MTATSTPAPARLSVAALLALGLALPVSAQTTPTPAPADAAAAPAATTPAPAAGATTSAAEAAGAMPAATAAAAPPSGTAPAEAAAAAPAAGTATEGAAPADAAAGTDTAAAEGAGAAGMPDLKPVTFENGRWYNAEGIPTYKIDENGDLDYATFSGYRRYHAECHVCHGPDGEGSTYAPALRKSVVGALDYYEYQQIVASGKQQGNLVMPAFGTNRNVWCYVDDIYTYLLARGTGDVPRGRPAKKAKKSDEYAALENSCMEN